MTDSARLEIPAATVSPPFTRNHEHSQGLRSSSYGSARPRKPLSPPPLPRPTVLGDAIRY